MRSDQALDKAWDAVVQGFIEEDQVDAYVEFLLARHKNDKQEEEDLDVSSFDIPGGSR